MKNQIATIRSLVSIIFFIATINCQASIPSKLDGFVYKNRPADLDSIVIEAFFDLVCPDSRDAWPPLKQALQLYGTRVSLIVHPFALPYHDNAFVTSRAMHIVDNLNSSATYDFMESIFKHQEMFYNQRTINMSRASVVYQLVKFVSNAIGSSYFSSVEDGFNDRKTDLATRVSFKYGCSRGVFGTPFFFVNGFALPDGGSPISYERWRSIIGPIVSRQNDENLQFFL